MDKQDILQYLKQKQNDFKNKYYIQKIGLFGSYARDEATDESDIDIFIMAKPSFYNIMQLKQELEKDLHKKVDIVRKHKHIKPFFLKMIYKDLIYV